MLYNWRSALLSTEEVGRVMIEEFFNYYTLLIVDLNQSQLTTTATTTTSTTTTTTITK